MLKLIKIKVTLDNVGFPHELAILIKRMTTPREHIVEHTAQRENVNSARGTSIGLRIDNRRFRGLRMLRLNTLGDRALVVIDQQFGSPPA